MDGGDTNKEQLSTQIVQEQDKLEELLDKIESENLMNKHTAFGDAIEELAKYKKKFDQCMDKIDQYREYEQSLGVSPADVAQIEKFN